MEAVPTAKEVEEHTADQGTEANWHESKKADAEGVPDTHSKQKREEEKWIPSMVVRDSQDKVIMR